MTGPTLGDDVRFLPGVGPARALTLARLGIRTVGGLLLHIPRSYLDRRFIRAIGSLEPGVEGSVSGAVMHSTERRIKGGRVLLHVFLSDGTGILDMVFFNAGFLRQRLSPGVRLIASGRAGFFRGPTMAHPEIIFLDDEQCSEMDSGRMPPVYPLTAGLTQGVMRGLVRKALDCLGDDLPDVLPPGARIAAGFGSRREVLVEIHSPSSPETAGSARRLLALEELFLHQGYLRSIREAAGVRPGYRLDPARLGEMDFETRLPFIPTGAQRRVMSEIRSDLCGCSAMRRLLQGDVGSGKTAVAAYACWAVAMCGLQSVILAPTEVLASQHHRNLSALLGPSGVRVALLTGGVSGQTRASILAEAASGAPMLLVGTHAVLEPPVSIPNLALLVVDEQHKFGVDQREALLSNRERLPHLLVMSATPIPRTLAMAFYGDLDVSVLDEMPPGRGRVFTRILNEEGRREAFDKLLERLGLGERAFIVYPLKEASESQDLLDAATSCERLAAGPAGRFGVGLLHGSMSPAEKNSRADDFAAGRISVLVSTTVVEVGLDIPEATVMIVSGAGRFGLSQLHQLRGRVGRSGRDSWCYLIAGRDTGGKAMERLEALAATEDGFELARRDLELRGPGDVLGTRQHGLPEFRVADLLLDGDLVPEAAELARRCPPDRQALGEMEWRFGARGAPAV